MPRGPERRVATGIRRLVQGPWAWAAKAEAVLTLTLQPLLAPGGGAERKGVGGGLGGGHGEELGRKDPCGEVSRAQNARARAGGLAVPPSVISRGWLFSV